MTRLFVLMAETGEYSERTVWAVAAYPDNESAQRAADEAAEYSSEQTALRDEYNERVVYPWWKTFWQKCERQSIDTAATDFFDRYPDAVRLRSSLPTRKFDRDLARSVPTAFEGTPHPVYGLSYETSYFVEEVPFIEEAP